MAIKEFTFKGKTVDELKKMDLKEFVNLIPARQRRSIQRGFTDQQKKLLEKVKKAKQGTYKKPIKTHSRDMIVIPELLDQTIHIHKGKGFIQIKIVPEMLSRFLGELVLTRGKVEHSAPGVGATKSSTAISAKK